jgi:hypothetical protein
MSNWLCFRLIPELENTAILFVGIKYCFVQVRIPRQSRGL